MKSYFFKNVMLGVIVTFLSGCSIVKFLSRVEKEIVPFPEVALKDYRGALHVHTYYPQNKKYIEKLAGIANKIGLDFVVISDHNSLAGLRDGKEGFYGRTLVLIGDEVSTHSGHLFVWGIRKPVDALDARKVAKQVRAQGGIIFIAHPFAKDFGWKDWTFTEYDGLEVYNTQANMLDEDFLSLVARGVVLFPDEFYRSIIKISPKAEAKWDQLLAKRRVIGIGSTDAHESHGLPGYEVESYNVMLKTVNCHIFAKNLTGENVTKAFRDGTLYFSFDIFADTKGFDFYLKRKGKKYLMGETVKAEPGDILTVQVNRTAYIRLLHNGILVHEDVADSAEIPVKGRGAYRVEVYLNHRPWIFSNPLYVE